MTNKQIEKILNKKSWTGREIGQVLIENYIRQLSDKEEILDQEQFNKMSRTVFGKQKEVLEVYLTIYDAIENMYNLIQAYNQQFYQGIERYNNFLTELQNKEILLSDMESFPVVISRKKYEEIKKAVEEKKKNTPVSYLDIFFKVLEVFIIEDDEKFEFIEIRKGMAVTNERILSNYNYYIHNGYFVAKNGKHVDASDTAKVENLFKSSEKEIKDNINKACEYIFRGEKYIQDTYKEKTGKRLTKKQTQEAINQLNHYIDKKTEIYAFEREEEHSYINVLVEDVDRYTFKPYEELPQALDQYEALMNFKQCYVEPLGKKKAYSEIKKDYPELAKQIQKYIKSQLGIDVPGTTNLEENITTIVGLSSKNFLNYKWFSKYQFNRDAQMYFDKDNMSDYIQRRRIAKQGIAVLDGRKDKSFISQNDKLLDHITGISDLQKDKEIYQLFKKTKDLIIDDALIHLSAYKALFKALSNAYKANIIIPTKMMDEPQIKINISICNNNLYQLYASIYGSQSIKEDKRRYMSSNFSLIDLDGYKISEDVITTLTNTFKAMGYSKKAIGTIKAYRSAISQIIEYDAKIKGNNSISS